MTLETRVGVSLKCYTVCYFHEKGLAMDTHTSGVFVSRVCVLLVLNKQPATARGFVFPLATCLRQRRNSGKTKTNLSHKGRE